MKKLICLCFGLLPGLSVNAQFYATNLPSVYGEYNLSYFSTNNVNVPAMLTLTTNSGPTLPGEEPSWDFSEKAQSQETVWRTDIISPSNGMDSGNFPAATYAEQYTVESLASTNLNGWAYYSINNQGRWYYGMYVPGTEADGLALFEPSNVDIPCMVTNGQTWSRSTSWNSTIDGFYPMLYEFSDTATVDAQGTLILPKFPSLQAWQVHEVHVYNGLLDGEEPPFEVETNQYYYWLVPGLGVAAQITIYGEVFVEGIAEAPTYTNSVQRMYYASYYIAPAGTSNSVPQDLFIHLQNGSVALNWLPFTDSANNLVSTGYQVQAVGSLSGTNWQILGLTSDTNWSDSLSSTQRYYRVIGFP